MYGIVWRKMMLKTKASMIISWMIPMRIPLCTQTCRLLRIFHLIKYLVPIDQKHEQLKNTRSRCVCPLIWTMPFNLEQFLRDILSECSYFIIAPNKGHAPN